MEISAIVDSCFIFFNLQVAGRKEGTVSTKMSPVPPSLILQ